ncbi:MAG: hypothetical protein FWC93_04095 [Defluviitaleaceae bacterium]|nr:hypothetical protein [Defluviitaleaceae bacterium]
MKKIFLLLLVVILAALFLVGCANDNGTTAGDDAIVISEESFVDEMIEILINQQQYLGRAVRYQGIFETIPWYDQNFFIVFRNTLGCCGEDEIIGLEVLMGDREPFPDNTWVEVTGTLEIYDGFLALRVSSIIEMDERGAELVF